MVGTYRGTYIHILIKKIENYFVHYFLSINFQIMKKKKMEK